MPTRRPFFVTGTPEMRYRFITSSAAEIFCSGSTVTGSTIMPLSERFTRSTSSACLSMGMLRWIRPTPPCCASAIARWDSVTVSMAALNTGMFSVMLRVPIVRVSVWAGTMSLCAGSSRTSSKVRPSRIVSRIMRYFYFTALGRSAPFVVDGDFQRPQEFLVLRGQFDLADSAPRRFLRRLDLHVFAIPGFIVLLALVESDGRFQDQEDIVAGTLDFTNRGGDAVGIGKRFVDRVPQFLHELL